MNTQTEHMINVSLLDCDTDPIEFGDGASFN